MIRHGVRGVLIAAVLALAIGASAGQPPTLDKVTIRDKKDGSLKTLEGTLKLAPGGFQVVGGKDKVLANVTPDDLVKITPGELPGINRGVILNLITSEDKHTKAEYESARLGYVDLQKKMAAGAPEAVRRYVDFKAAFMATRVADESSDEEKWPELADAAIKAWSSFLGDYKSGWEVWTATRTQARLLIELNKYDELSRLWARTAKTPDLPADLALEATLRQIDADMRSGGASSASVAAETLLKTTAPGAAKDKLAIYALAAKATKSDYAKTIQEIETAIAKTKDPTVRGVGFGMIGELYLLAGKPRDAMWAFLWVETVYSQDRTDVLKAMSRLVQVFKLLADEDRAKAYREKIRRHRNEFGY